MFSILKTTASAAMLLAGSLAFSASVLAAPCPGTQLLNDFIGAPCTDIDKLYTYLNPPADTLPDHANINAEISNFNIGPIDFHNFSLNPVNPITAAGIYTFAYSIQIIDPTKFFGIVTLGSDVSLPDVRVDKTIDLDGNTGNGSFATLVSLSGSTSFVAIPPNVQMLWIYDTVRVDQGDVAGFGGALNSFTNVFTESALNVPEPATLALFGLGLAGLGLARRRKQR